MAPVERLPSWARLVLAAMFVAVAVSVGLAVTRPDSPWCSDEDDDSCPEEVRFQDRMYVVTCTDPIPPSRRGESVDVRFHDGTQERTRTAWSLDGVPIEQVLVLAPADNPTCPGTEIAYGGLSEADAITLLRP